MDENSGAMILNDRVNIVTNHYSVIILLIGIVSQVLTFYILWPLHPSIIRAITQCGREPRVLSNLAVWQQCSRILFAKSIQYWVATYG